MANYINDTTCIIRPMNGFLPNRCLCNIAAIQATQYNYEINGTQHNIYSARDYDQGTPKSMIVEAP